MSVPTYESMMRPTLEILSERGPQQFRQLANMVAAEMQLTDDDRAVTIESGQAVYVNRVGWAVTYLVQAGAIRRPQRGVAEITERGRRLLSTQPGPISNSDLAQFDEFQAFRKRSRRTATSADDGLARREDANAATGPDRTPEEVMAATVATVHAALTGELLDRVMELTPVASKRWFSGFSAP